MPVLCLMLGWSFSYMTSKLLLPLSHSSKLTFALKTTKDVLARLLRTLPSLLILSLVTEFCIPSCMCLIVTCCLWHYIQCYLKVEFLFCIYVAYLYSWIRGLPTAAGIQICCGSESVALCLSNSHISVSLLCVQYFTNGT